MLFVGCPASAWGYIPSFLDEDDPRPARDQIAEHYISGWLPAPPGLKFDRERMLLTYPGDPPFEPLGALMFRREMLLLFVGDFVVILQPDGTWEAARLD